MKQNAVEGMLVVREHKPAPGNVSARAAAALEHC